MIGAIIGDICGSRFERYNHRSKKFSFFHPYCCPTDDTNMTLAVAAALCTSNGDLAALPEAAVRSMQMVGREYPHGFGHGFREWVFSENPRPYHSYGNGAAMRVSPCAWAASTMEEALAMADAVTAVTHDHPEGMKGARAVVSAIWLARTGSTIDEIRTYINQQCYTLDFTIDGIRDTYTFSASCQGSVPQAIEAFLESTSFEDAIRTAISVGGDSDTIAAITGSIAEAYYGVPEKMREFVLQRYLDEDRREILQAFENKYGKPEDKADDGRA